MTSCPKPDDFTVRAGRRDHTERMRVVPTLLLLAASAPGIAWAQNAVTLGSASGYGTLEAGGVVLVISGDANSNATATLEYRATGAPTSRPGHPLVRTDATHLVGSLFDLSPGSNYDVRVTLADPDGVVGTATATTSVATRSGTLAATTRTLYVATTGSDASSGLSAAAPLRTIQHAADLAQPGDLVSIAPGIYRESVAVPRSGSAAQPIVFRGEAAGAILDGSDAAIAQGAAFVAVGNGVYTRVLGFATGQVVSELGRLFPYGSQAALTAQAAGAPGGFYFDGTTLFVRFFDGSPPSQHVLDVARLENGFVVDGRSYIRIENLEIRHYGADAYGKGVYLRYASDSAVRDSLIHENGAAGVWIKGGQRHLVEHNRFYDTAIENWPWDQTKGSSAENNAVVLTDEIGRGHVIRGNAMTGLFNGVGPCGSAAPTDGGYTSEVDLYDNEVSKINDDAFEPEGYCANVRLWRNTIRGVHMAFAVAPANPGPVWIVRNTAYDVGATRTSQVDGYTASGLKINSGYATPVGPILLYHNTFLTTAPSTNALTLLDPGASTVIRARNNVFAGTRYVLEKINPVALDLDADALSTTDGARFVKWEGTTYATLAALRSGRSQELAGIAAAPLLVAPAAGDFRPQDGSPLIDAGVVLPGLNDAFDGAAPDIGAVEHVGVLFRDGFE